MRSKLSPELKAPNDQSVEEREQVVAPKQNETFDMTVLNDLDRFHLVMDTIDRLPQTGDKGAHLKQQLIDKLTEHNVYIRKYGLDMPEIRNWKWANKC